MQTGRDRIQALLKDKPILDSKDISSVGVDRKIIQRMTLSGELIQLSRGLYCDPNYIPEKDYSLLESHKLIQRGRICLISALSYWEIGTQNPSMVWLALPRKTWSPDVSQFPIQKVYFSDKAYTEGVTTIRIENEGIPIYSIPKTIADCFKFRNKVGLDVAVEALKDVLNRKLASIDEILHYADICRVRKVITPYLESLV